MRNPLPCVQLQPAALTLSSTEPAHVCLLIPLRNTDRVLAITGSYTIQHKLDIEYGPMKDF